LLPDRFSAARVVSFFANCQSAALPVDPALFCLAAYRCEHRSAASCPGGTPPFRFSGHVFNAPLLFNA